MSRGLRLAVALLLAFAILGLFAWLFQGRHIDVLSPAGVVADEQRKILLFALILSMFVVIPVFGILTFVSLKYRASKRPIDYSPEWGESKRLELIWWGVPIAIIAVLGTVIYNTSHSLDPYKKIAGDNAIEVQVIGLQWKWLFIYPDYGVASLNRMPIPVDTPIRLVLTTEAPMSALWYPALGSQIYAMNGMESQLNVKATKLGQYKGYNTNINGEGYAKMIATADAISMNDFLKWTSNTKTENNLLDMPVYEEIAEPEIVRDFKSYRLDDTSIYDTVLMRNMTHGAGASMHHGPGATHE